MLINFSLKNWMSFKKEAEITTKASNERRNNDSLSRIKKYSLRILPTSAIFGLNATGKSSFIEAIAFCKNFITNPRENFNENVPLGYRPYKLDASSFQKETEFAFRILVNEEVFDYSFSLLNNCVNKEELKKYNKTSEIKIFEREGQKVEIYYENLRSEKDQEFFKYVKASLPNQLLFLTYAIRQNVDELRPIYDWFLKDLHVLSASNGFSEENKLRDKTVKVGQQIDEILRGLATGIDRLEVDSDEKRKQDLLKAILSTMPFNSQKPLLAKEKEDTEKIVNASGRPKLISIHKSVTGEDIPFDLKEESGGTKRIIDLAPAFHDLSNPDKKVTYVIDDFDRSLHPNLTHYLIQYF